MKEITQLCYDARNYALLNSSITTLSKKHGQFKASTQAMVEQAMGWLDDIRTREGDEKWLELIETLRAVTEGKARISVAQARDVVLNALLDLPRDTTSPSDTQAHTLL